MTSLSTPPLRVGVIGAGIGRAHLAGYHELGAAVEIAALCDLNEARLHEVADQYNVPHRYTDLEEMLTSGLIDAVSICLPNSLHAPASIAAFEAGLHVLCEKPLAQSTALAAEIVIAAAQTDRVFMVCYNRRYRPDIIWMKQLLDTGQLGRIYHVKAGWVRETGIPSGWFSDKALAGGGPLIDLGVHMIDAVLWLLGYPTVLTVSGDVRANFGPYGRKFWFKRSRELPPVYDVEDSATAYIRLAGDVSFQFETSWASHLAPDTDDFYLTLMGTEGTAELYVHQYATENTLTLYTEVGEQPVVTKPAIKKAHRSDHIYAVADFVRCIQEGINPEATAARGLTVMQTIEAVYESSRTRREVVLSEE